MISLSAGGRNKVEKKWWRIAFGVFVLSLIAFGIGQISSAEYTGQRLVTVYDRGQTLSFVTEAKTVQEALSEQGFELDNRDTVEPSRDEELVASDYQINIYRARPVVVTEGSIRTKTVSPYQTPEGIVRDAGFTLYAEDRATVSQSTDLLYDGAGLHVVIERAVSMRLDLFGRTMDIRTRGKTVADMLKEKNVVLTAQDRTSLDVATPITPGLYVRVWREGKQTISVDQEIPFASEIVYDADRPIGYRATKSKGQAGLRTITYEVEIKEGVQISKVEIANIATLEPKKQVEVIGIYNNGSGLTKSRGAQYFTDSKGISHRETYYDLNMSVVMKSCGQGGRYSVRPDGAKVDAQGYIIIAANYTRYPKCSVVETSLGLGKVYDTGGFAAKHPDGFDLATDWSRQDGI